MTGQSPESAAVPAPAADPAHTITFATNRWGYQITYAATIGAIGWDAAVQPVPVAVEFEVPLVPPAYGRPAAPPLTANQRLHWHRAAELRRMVRTTIRYAATYTRIGRCRHLTVQLHYRPGDNRRRDPSNLMPTQKPAVDGLVDAGLVPDDTPEWVTELMPVIHPGPGPRRLWLTVQIHQEGR